MPGVLTIIAAQNTDYNSVVVPENELFEITRVEIYNKGTTDVEVGLYDTYTDTDGTAHSSTSNQDRIFYYKIVANSDAIMDTQDKAKRLKATGILRAVGAGIGVSNQVFVHVGGRYAFADRELK